MNKPVVSKFLKYVRIDTSSNINSNKTPSSDGQLKLAKLLVSELRNLGINNVHLNEKSYVYAKLPSNIKKKKASIGFIAHLDTSPDVTSKNVNPQIICYKGKNISNKKGVVIINEDDNLKKFINKKIITTDGSSLLGADDKAGIAEIISALEIIIKQNIPHCDIYIAFVPDEEIGHQVKYFNKKLFKAKIAYTIDGGDLGELEGENFNGDEVVLSIKGRMIHPGYAKGRLVNPAEIISRFLKILYDKKISPNEFHGETGFIHVTEINSRGENGYIKMIVRDFSIEKLNKKHTFIKITVEKINSEFKKRFKDFTGGITIEINSQYRNMKDIIKKDARVIDFAEKAMINANLKPLLKKIHGGTDGAALAKMGIKCPNIFTGGYNFHSTSEWIPIESMEKAVSTIIEIVKIWSNKFIKLK